MAVTKTELLVLCDNYFGSREKTKSWLQTPVLALGNQTPESLTKTENGIEQVYDCILKLQHGMTS
jgi:putative toxin-antitoxin system antitoxin component (TIGR02293 family)